MYRDQRLYCGGALISSKRMFHFNVSRTKCHKSKSIKCVCVYLYTHLFIAVCPFFVSFLLFLLVTHLDVLSAAHCVHSIDRREIKIYIGGHNITSDYVDTRRVARIFEHEYFDTVSFDFDIAILELSKPIAFGPKVQPACLPQAVFQDYSGKTGIIAGWGRLGECILILVFFCRFSSIMQNLCDETPNTSHNQKQINFHNA